VPNYYDPALTSVLSDGLVLAVEPMATLEPAHVVEEADGWTLRTHNRSVAAHYEHTIVIRGATPLVVTRVA
jgi:methionyl aminopeptidase